MKRQPLNDNYLVRWAGQQAVAALPEHMDVSNAGQIREELLLAINRGATTLIADMTATISCDHAGADAVARAYQRAASSGAQLRLVVTAPVVSRMLSLAGLDRLIPIYPSLEAARAASAPAVVPAPIAATARTGTNGPAPARRSGRETAPLRAARPPEGDRAGLGQELPDTIITSLFHVGLSLQAAIDLPAEKSRQHINEALGHLDEAIRVIRDTAFACRAHGTRPHSAPFNGQARFR